MPSSFSNDEASMHLDAWAGRRSEVMSNLEALQASYRSMRIVHATAASR